MKKLLAMCVAACACASFADDMVWKNESVTIRLQLSPCTHASVLRFIPLEIQGEFHTGYVLFNGKNIAACWAAIDDKVTLVDERGDGGTIEQSAFKRDAGV